MKKKFNLLILLGLLFGIIGGLFIPEIMQKLNFLGTIYVNLLKFMIIPIIFTSIMVTIYNSAKEKSKLVLKTVVLFTLMFIITFVLTSLIVSLIKPGIGFNYEIKEWNGEIAKINFSDIIVNLFPSSIITILQNNAVFPSIILAVFSGVCALKVKHGNKVIELVDGLKNIFNKMLEYIMYLTPIGVFALIGNTIGNYGSGVFVLGAKYIGMAYLCSLIALILIIILPVWLIAKINPFIYVKKIYKIWLITITTCSSTATLPYTIKTCNEELHIPEKITNIVVPLGCTIHMLGGAVSFALLGLFCTQLFNINVTIPLYLLMLLSATLINMAAPGIPNGGIVIGATYLSLLGIPLTFIGFYSGIYKLLDMIYTTLNVTGDISANLIINKLIKK